MRWRTAPGFSNYKISEYGDVRCLNLTLHRKLKIRKNKFKKLIPDKVSSGYTRFCMKNDLGEWDWQFAHRLVALAFYGLPTGNKICALHKDDNKENNFYKNLYWGSYVENSRDKATHGNVRIEKDHHNSKLNYAEAKRIRKEYKKGSTSQTKLAEKYKVSQVTISRIILGRIYKQAA